MAVKHYVIVNREGLSLVYNSENGNYVQVKDEGQSSSMASLNALLNVLENLDENSEDLTVILVPKSLGLLLKMDAPKTIQENGYKTEKGTELTKEYVDLMVYANELREWLGTNIVRLKIHGSTILYKNEVNMINACWNKLDEILKPANKRPNRPNKTVAKRTTKPVKPQGTKITKATDLEE